MADVAKQKFQKMFNSQFKVWLRIRFFTFNNMNTILYYSFIILKTIFSKHRYLAREIIIHLKRRQEP